MPQEASRHPVLGTPGGRSTEAAAPTNEDIRCTTGPRTRRTCTGAPVRAGPCYRPSAATAGASACRSTCGCNPIAAPVEDQQAALAAALRVGGCAEAGDDVVVPIAVRNAERRARHVLRSLWSDVVRVRVRRREGWRDVALACGAASCFWSRCRASFSALPSSFFVHARAGARAGPRVHEEGRGQG